jgi:hypothetical protein
MIFHRLLVKLVCLPLNNPQGILRTFSQACTQPVAVLVGNEPGLSIHYFNSSLRAGYDTLSAAITALIIYLHNFSFYFHAITSFQIFTGSHLSMCLSE